jgi:predicted DNA-binding protein
MPTKDKATEEKLQNEADDLRGSIEAGVAFVEGQKAIQSFSAFTVEDAIDAYIERIEGADTDARPNVLNRIKKVTSEVVSAVARSRSLPPEAFREKKPGKDVNSE